MRINDCCWDEHVLKRKGKQMLKKTRATLLLALTMLLVVEAALQLRSHVRYGQSVFNAVSADTTYVYNEEVQLKLLAPDNRIAGSQAIIESNSYGLRDDAILALKPEGELRVAIVGASTVMGTYTRDNKDTLSYQLQALLNASGNVQARVINAGIAGYSLSDQRGMVERLLSRLDIDRYVLYTGFNDLSRYCRTETDKPADAVDYSLPAFELPKWLLTTELITKNTVSLRTSVADDAKLVSPHEVDATIFTSELQRLAKSLVETGKPVLIMGNSWAFRRGMTDSERNKLSETARYYKSCFDTDGLEVLFENHNSIIENMAKEYGFDFFHLNDELSGGQENFGDSTHFSIIGTRLTAQILAKQLVLHGYIPGSGE